MINPTPKQAAKMLKHKILRSRIDDIQVIRKTCGKTVWIDNRTVRRPYPEPADVYLFAMDSMQVYIICPYCQQIHVHGGDDVGGMRVSHCFTYCHPNYRIMPIAAIPESSQQNLRKTSNNVHLDN